MNRTFVIAEPGSCHDGDLGRAIRLVAAAAVADADAVKFQYWSSPEKLAAQRQASNYLEIYQRYKLNPSWVPVLKQACEDLGVEFMLTVYLRDDLVTVGAHARRVKIASFEADSNLTVDALMELGQDHDVIVSAGMLDEDRLMALTTLRDRYHTGRLSVLQCTSAYPAPLDQVNLSTIARYYLDGLSDHTTHPWTGALAVAAGARIVEAHLKLEDTDPSNPDAPHARGPAAFADYVRNIRTAEELLGDWTKRVVSAEKLMLPYRVATRGPM